MTVRRQTVQTVRSQTGQALRAVDPIGLASGVQWSLMSELSDSLSSRDTTR